MPSTKRTTDSKPEKKVAFKKIPCSLCHRVVEELKYHYDICEECHDSPQSQTDSEAEADEIKDHVSPQRSHASFNVNEHQALSQDDLETDDEWQESEVASDMEDGNEQSQSKQL